MGSGKSKEDIIRGLVDLEDMEAIKKLKLKPETVGSLITWSCAFGRVKVMKYLNEKGVNSKKLILLASMYGHLPLVRYFWETQNQFELPINEAIDQAGSNGHLSVVKFLHEMGGDISKDDNKAFCSACFSGHFEIVKYIYEAQPTPEAKMRAINARREYPIHWSYYNKHFDIWNYLQEKKRTAGKVEPWRANLTNVEDIPAKTEKTCVICMVNEPIVVLSCGHKRTCGSCTLTLLEKTMNCPICRGCITFASKVYD